MLNIYQFLTFLLIPIIKLNVKIRIRKGKEDKKRYIERYGINTVNKPKGKLIWIHAASVGEFKSSAMLIENLYKRSNILVTTTTLTAAKYASEHYGKKIIHQYAPLDVKQWVKKFIYYWKPALIIWVESDLWPTTLNTIKENSIKSIVLNLRVSPKSYSKWLIFKNFYNSLIDPFSNIYAQSLNDKKRIENLNKKRIEFLGNLKFSSEENKTNKILLKRRRKFFKNYKILLFASTHNLEEKLFMHCIKRLINKYNDLKIIIAPRHPERSIKLLELFKKNKLNTSLFNKSRNFNEKIFIVNTMGEMKYYFSLSDFVFLGGSLVNLGGHNPIEPAKNDCVIATGSHIYNWENTFLEMQKNKICSICNNVEEFEKFFIKIYNKKTKINMIKKNTKKFAEKQKFKKAILIKTINKLIKKI